MAYIEKEKVSEIRKQVKAAFPKFKFSVTWDRPSAVCIRIMEGPIDLGSQESFNHYHPDHTKNEDFKNMSLKIMDIIRQIKPVDYRETGDYGNQPNYYAYVKIGKWNKPYKIVSK